jgi:homoserine kinase
MAFGRAPQTRTSCFTGSRRPAALYLALTPAAQASTEPARRSLPMRVTIADARRKTIVFGWLTPSALAGSALHAPPVIGFAHRGTRFPSL